MVLTYADPSVSRGKATPGSDVVEARFVDLVPGVRVVQAVDFVSDDPAYAGTHDHDLGGHGSRWRNPSRHHGGECPRWDLAGGPRHRHGLFFGEAG